MPIYEYQCEQGHTFEILQTIDEPEIRECQECEELAHRLISPVNFVLKGPGFYVNDYKKRTQIAEPSPVKKPKPQQGEHKDQATGKAC
ncbi:MAG: zinc ribbon domain-containing protein [Proteobacteria bacterium]|nr:zinc ribbon domain-containing protein [Pseudomonadota bacterium]